ncbi:MAG: hypothetical protein H6564_21400 [Lewinellaceae bacterium]|nr:hypothetical protein [Lewinellaceae bacterium]
MTRPLRALIFTLLTLAMHSLCHTKIQAQPGESPNRYIKDTLDINKTVAVIPFSTSFDYDSRQADYSRMLTERAQTAIEQTKRFIMVERIDLEKVIDIKRDQDENDQEYIYWSKVSDSHLIKAGRMLGVEYIFTGNISNVATPIVLSGGYSGEFGFTIKVISVETGKIYVTEDFSESTDQIIGKNSKKEALNAALDKLVEPVQEFIDKYFPLRIPFYRVQETNNKGYPKSLIIRGGLSNGLRVGQELDMALKGDKEDGFMDKIGEVEIVEISANYSTCKVLKGAENIGLNIANNPDRVIANTKSYKSKGLFRGINRN